MKKLLSILAATTLLVGVCVASTADPVKESKKETFRTKKEKCKDEKKDKKVKSEKKDKDAVTVTAVGTRKK